MLSIGSGKSWDSFGIGKAIILRDRVAGGRWRGDGKMFTANNEFAQHFSLEGVVNSKTSSS